MTTISNCNRLKWHSKRLCCSTTVIVIPTVTVINITLADDRCKAIVVTAVKVINIQIVVATTPFLVTIIEIRTAIVIIIKLIL